MLAALDLSHVRPLDASHVGQSFLRDPIFRPCGNDSGAESPCRL